MRRYYTIYPLDKFRKSFIIRITITIISNAEEN